MTPTGRVVVALAVVGASVALGIAGALPGEAVAALIGAVVPTPLDRRP